MQTQHPTCPKEQSHLPKGAGSFIFRVDTDGLALCGGVPVSGFTLPPPLFLSVVLLAPPTLTFSCSSLFLPASCGYSVSVLFIVTIELKQGALESKRTPL